MEKRGGHRRGRGGVGTLAPTARNIGGGGIDNMLAFVARNTLVCAKLYSCRILSVSKMLPVPSRYEWGHRITAYAPAPWPDTTI